MEVSKKNIKIAEEMLENYVEAKEFNDAISLCNNILTTFPENEKAVFYSGFLSIVPKHFNLIKTFSIMDKNFDKTIELLKKSKDEELEKRFRYENYINKVVKVLQDYRDKLKDKVFPNGAGKPDFSSEHMYKALDLYSREIVFFIDKFWNTHLNNPLYEMSKTKISNLKKDILNSVEWPFTVLGNNLLYRENDQEQIEMYFLLYDLYHDKRLDWLVYTFPETCKSWEMLEPRFLEYKKEADAFQKDYIEREEKFKTAWKKSSFFTKNKLQKQIIEFEEEKLQFLKKTEGIIEDYSIAKRSKGWVENVTYNRIDLINTILNNFKQNRKRALEKQYQDEYRAYLDIKLSTRSITAD